MHANPTALEIIAAGPVSVLDRGHVHLLDVMGTDASIASDARASRGNEGKARSAGQDRGLIRRLMRDVHTSPFEMAELKFHVKAPIHVARQQVRHRTASWSERSGRYTELPPDEFQLTTPGAWRLQDPGNKQGSAGTLPASADLDFHDSLFAGGNAHSIRESNLLREADYVYRQRLAAGIAREQARKDLPQSAYTEWVWKIDLHNLLHFLRLRLAPDAQLEIRLYAQAIAAVVGRLFPITWEAFVDYRLEAMTLSRAEVGAIVELTQNCFPTSIARAAILGSRFENHRERGECVAKLVRLGLVAEEGGAA